MAKVGALSVRACHYLNITLKTGLSIVACILLMSIIKHKYNFILHPKICLAIASSLSLTNPHVFHPLGAGFRVSTQYHAL
jgi:hypothetical protein